MPKGSELATALADRTRTNVSLHGRRAADRYDDDELATLAELTQLEKLSLLRQPITRLPPLAPTVRWLWVGGCELESLAGIERLTSLQTLWLTDLPRLDLDALCEQLAELPELTELQLGGATITALPAAIANAPSVLALHLNEVPRLDLADAFGTLGKLATLRKLTITQIPKLPDALAPLAQLHELAAGGFGDEFPPSVGALAELRKLVVHGQYKALPKTIGRLQKLEALVVKGNPMARLPDELCACAALEVLDADDTWLQTLPADIGSLSKLRKLNVSTKKLRTLPASIGKLGNLRELRVPWTERLQVPESLFELKLETFLGPKKISDRLALLPPPPPEEDRVYIYDRERIPADFGNPKELVIRLEGHAEPLPQLSRLRRLQEITIDTGNLADAFARLAGCESLRALTIEGEHASLPSELTELVQLASLDIDSGHPSYTDRSGVLEQLPAGIGKLVHLETLTLGRHRMTRLPDELGQLASLRSLSLRVGPLVELPETLGELANLEALHLATLHSLAALPVGLARCTKLARFSIVGWDVPNRIANLDLLAQLPGLRELSLTRNRAVDLPRLLRAFAGHPLEKLELDGTDLAALPPEIGGLAKLRRLALDGTELTTLPAALKQCTELRWISIPYPVARLDDVKALLPKGRWKKQFRSGVTWYERSD